MIKKKINHALIMAAGRGIRMKPLTDKLPKAMAPFNGSTLISEGIKELKKHISNIHITVGYKGEMLSSHLMNNNVTSIINTENKGNCWWLFNSLIKNLNEPIFVLTCDNVLDLNFTKINKFKTTHNLYAGNKRLINHIVNDSYYSLWKIKI